MKVGTIYDLITSKKLASKVTRYSFNEYTIYIDFVFYGKKYRLRLRRDRREDNSYDIIEWGSSWDLLDADIGPIVYNNVTTWYQIPDKRGA